ncbi:retrotransposon hot spot (RHS) protein, putative [Trypanosoma cruzi marinkellei]|uniref:Retrotransposon hot spot (RHS) protein, putative n=1 Tax=Trypanosoma cruzi marinkellei TaxID=85056 RepID=K2NVE2_TRYCR|nr:retrotransposon hot spot (RHS) protein, putative [Trypanosoma cruzi marinkellei]
MAVLGGSGKYIRDCHVNCEVDRVWQTVSSDLTEWFSNFDLSRIPSPARRVMIGTPGIGKSMAAGSYLLYQLLHYDVEKLQVVVHCSGDTAYVFDKTTQTVTKYEGKTASKSVVDGLWHRGMKGYIIYDVAEKRTPPAKYFAPASGWGMIVVSSPKVSNYDEWEKQVQATKIVMNCPDESDVRAMCAWLKHDANTQEQEKYWKLVKKNMNEVGAILRFIFDEKRSNGRSDDIDKVMKELDEYNAEQYIGVMSDKIWEAENPSHILVQSVRVIGKSGNDSYVNYPASKVIASKIYVHLSKKMCSREILNLLVRPAIFSLSNVLEISGTATFMDRGIVDIIKNKLKELKPPGERASRLAALQRNPQGHPTDAMGLLTKEDDPGKHFAECGVIYKPAVVSFPLVDASFFMESPRKTMVGLQMTTAGQHDTTASTVREFTEYLSCFFKNWGNFSETCGRLFMCST